MANASAAGIYTPRTKVPADAFTPRKSAVVKSLHLPRLAETNASPGPTPRQQPSKNMLERITAVEDVYSNYTPRKVKEMGMQSPYPGAPVRRVLAPDARPQQKPAMQDARNAMQEVLDEPDPEETPERSAAGAGKMARASAMSHEPSPQAGLTQNVSLQGRIDELQKALAEKAEEQRKAEAKRAVQAAAKEARVAEELRRAEMRREKQVRLYSKKPPESEEPEVTGAQQPEVECEQAGASLSTGQLQHRRVRRTPLSKRMRKSQRSTSKAQGRSAIHGDASEPPQPLRRRKQRGNGSGSPSRQRRHQAAELGSDGEAGEQIMGMSPTGTSSVAAASRRLKASSRSPGGARSRTIKPLAAGGLAALNGRATSSAADGPPSKPPSKVRASILGPAKDKLRMHVGQEMDSEVAWRNLFSMVQHDGQVHRDDIPTALEMSGAAVPNMTRIDEVYGAITTYSALSEDEFILFMRQYTLRQNEAFALAFERRLDEDAEEPEVRLEKLPELVRDLGILPMKHVLADVIKEVVESQDNWQRKNTIGLHDFLKLARLLLLREGFAKQEYDELLRLFHRFDRDKSGDMSAGEFHNVLTRLGYSLDERRVQTLLQGADVDKSGRLGKQEYFMCMRKVREREVKIIEDLIKMNDADRSGTTNAAELEDILKALGYTPMPGAILEATRDAGVAIGTEVGIEDVWHILAVYRKRGGFTADEAKQIHHVFDREDKDEDGELDQLEVISVIQELGYHVGFHEIQSYIRKVDLDNNLKLDFLEFVNMLQAFAEKEMTRARAAFSAVGTSILNQKQAVQAMLVACNEEVKEDTAKKALAPVAIKPEVNDEQEFAAQSDKPQPYVDMQGFLSVAMSLLRRVRVEVYERHGFRPSETSQLRQLFQSYSSTAGKLELAELAALVQDVFTEVIAHPTMGPVLTESMSTAGTASRGELTFNDFLKFMQRMRRLQDAERVARENLAIEITQFGGEEVEEFRELFADNDTEKTGELDQALVKKLINGVSALPRGRWTDMLAAARKKLHQKRTDINFRHNALFVDFGEFLVLMKEVLQVWDESGLISDDSTASARGGAGRRRMAVKQQTDIASTMQSPTMRRRKSVKELFNG